MMVIVEQLVEWRLAGETEVLWKTSPRATLSTTNPTWPDPGSNLGSLGGKSATNRLSYGAAHFGNEFTTYNFFKVFRLYADISRSHTDNYKIKCSSSVHNYAYVYVLSSHKISLT
jgi:hypothetical protein